MALCPLGFDFISNAATLQVDHFFPEDLFIKNINQIAAHPTLRAEIKSALQVLNKAHGSALSSILIDKLFPLSGPLSALQNIYYNYPNNLWPLSGHVNSKKGASHPFAFAIACARKELDAMDVSFADNAMANTEASLMAFDSIPRQGQCIIPHLLVGGKLCTGLEYYLLTPVGKVTRKICSDTAKIGQMGMEAAYALAIQLQSKTLRPRAKAMVKAKEIFDGVHQEILPYSTRAPIEVDDDQYDSSSSLGSEGIHALETTRDLFRQAVDEVVATRKQRKFKEQFRTLKMIDNDLSHSKGSLARELRKIKKEHHSEQNDSTLGNDSAC